MTSLGDVFEEGRMNIWEVEDEVEAETLKEQELSQSGEGASRDPSKAKSSSGRRAFPAPNTLRDGYLGRSPISAKASQSV